MVRFLSFILLGFLVLHVNGQKLFENEEAMTLVRRGANKVYRIQMDSAQYFADNVEEMLPNHPVVPAMEAFIIMW